jgi:hypothetical protein
VTESACKARRQLVLWSALLLAWVFIGVDVAKMSGAAGDAAKAISNPGALPLCLTLIVAYFFYRWCFEWRSLELPQRSASLLRLDAPLTFWVGWTATASGVLFLVFSGEPAHGPAPSSLATGIPLISGWVAFAGISRARRLAAGLRLFQKNTFSRVLMVSRRPHTWSLGDHLTIFGFTFGETAIFSAVLVGVFAVFFESGRERTLWLIGLGFVIFNYLFLPWILIAMGLIRRSVILKSDREARSR